LGRRASTCPKTPFFAHNRERAPARARPRYNSVVNRLLTVSVALTLLATLCFGEQLRFRGTVKRGQSFLRGISNALTFGLDPTDWKTVRCDGWHVWIGLSRDENFADLATGPLHGFSTLDICAADFRNSNNSGPNIGDVNRPGKVRQLRFVTTRSEDEQLAKLAENPASAKEGLARIRFNNGSLTITRLSHGHLQPGTPPTIEEMDFIVTLDIPKEGRR